MPGLQTISSVKQAPLLSVKYKRYNLCSFKIICLRYDYLHNKPKAEVHPEH
jgi:hypothetical protein